MTLKICFELTDRDLQFFRKALRQSREAVKDAEDSEIVEAIHSALDEIRSSEPLPDFVGKRIPELESLISMLTDEEWQLPEADRERLLATFVYFADPEEEIIGILMKQTEGPVADQTGWKFRLLVGQAIDD